MSGQKNRPSLGEIAKLPYRRGVGIMLLNRAGQVFVAQRIDAPGEAWQMPQGGIDKGETPRAAAMRELEEETGTAKASILAVSREWRRYDLPSELAARIWRGRYRGQEQLWFAMAFEGEDKDIDIATEHPEFSAWRWAELEDLAGQIVDFKRPLYEALVEEFRALVEDLRRA